MEPFMMREKSYAKITLSLYAYKEDEVLKFKNVLVPIDLFDMVYMTKNNRMEITSNKRFLPNDKRNTVYFALELLKEKYGIEDNFKVHIVKNIPAQSGMGGGSSNAATIINMVNELYGLEMTLEDKMSIASQIDEDTPFFVESKPATVEGIGEIIHPITLTHDLYYVAVKPGFGVSTKMFLEKFDDIDPAHAHSMEAMKKACETGSYEDIIQNRFNSFQDTVLEQYKAMGSVMEELEALGLDGVTMTGSGSCIVGLSQNKSCVMEIFERISLKYPFVKYGRVLKECGGNV